MGLLSEKRVVTTPPTITAPRSMELARKIATMMVDRINQEIIRPGPKPEERECYVVAQELRDLTPQLTDLVAQILKVDADERRV